MSKFCRTRIRVSICIFILFVLPSVLANSSNPLLRGSDNGSPAEESLGRDTWPRHRKLVLAANGTSTINEWIIMFKGDRGKILQRILNDKAKIVYEFRKFLNAIVVAGLSTAALNWLLERDEILLIEQEQPVSLFQTNTTQTLQSGQPWGLDYVDGTVDTKYSYSWTGRGVNVYVFDTGIQLNHNEFLSGKVSRATCGINLIDATDNKCRDDKGHGTHVAGTIGGVTYGLAKEANLIAVKVLDENGDGTTTGVIRGLEYVVEQKSQLPTIPMIANLSLGSGKSTLLNEAVNRAVEAGVTVVGASGNESVDACTTSPASAERSISVGAMTNLFRRPNWSNYGACVDLHAPGSDVLSSFSDVKDQTKTFIRSGTSMAAPHVSGVAAMYLARNNSLTPDDLLVELKRDALANKIIGLIGSTNLLLSSAAIRKSPPIVPAPVQSPASSPSQSNIPVPDNSTSLPPSQTPDKPQACGIVIFSRCEVDSDCCLKACRQFGELLDKRCFFF